MRLQEGEKGIRVSVEKRRRRRRREIKGRRSVWRREKKSLEPSLYTQKGIKNYAIPKIPF